MFLELEELTSYIKNCFNFLSYGAVFMWPLNFILIIGIVVTFVTNSHEDMLTCKKCGTEHEKPVGNKCDRIKMDKEEKKDANKEQLVKKTPKSKPSTSAQPQDKMMELMLASMSSFTEKLAAMEERITGLTERPQENLQEPAGVCKPRSREKSKKREPSDERLNIQTTHAVIQSDTGVSYSKVCPDTAVVLKHSATPARVKKPKHDADLGVAPLARELISPAPFSIAPFSSKSNVYHHETHPFCYRLSAWGGDE